MKAEDLVLAEPREVSPENYKAAFRRFILEQSFEELRSLIENDRGEDNFLQLQLVQFLLYQIFQSMVTLTKASAIPSKLMCKNSSVLILR